MADKINFPKITIEKEIPNETLEQIKQIVPDAIEDGKINCKKLKEAISKMVVDPDEPEHFGLNWPGKRQSIKLARTPSKRTLIPVPGDGVDEDKTQNLFIEGENMEVLKLLQKSYSGKIKMIYIDPPYNTGSDLIYKDKFTESEKSFLESTGQIDNEGNDMVANKKASGRFHTNWLNMIYPRLKLAKELLTDDGVIFVSIDDNEIHNLRTVMNEIFGEENFIEIFSWQKTETPPNLSKLTKKSLEYILCYRKSNERKVLLGLSKTSESSNGLMNQTNSFKKIIFPANKIYTGIEDGLIKAGKYGTSKYRINLLEDTEVKKGVFIKSVTLEGKFKWTQENLYREIADGTVVSIRTKSFSPSYERNDYEPESPWNYINRDFGVGTNENASEEISKLFGIKEIFDHPKTPSLIKYLLGFLRDSKNEENIILDFFAGSGTTGHAVMQLNAEDKGNRKFICVQMPEATKEDSEAFKAGYKNIAEIAKERIRRAGKKIKEETKAEIDYGFKVFKLQKESNLKDESEMFGMTDQLTLESAEENLSSLRKGWTKEKLLTEILLIEGFPLTSTIEKASITTNEVLIVTSSFEDRPDKLIVCLDPEINRATIDNLPVGDLDNFIFLESSLPKVGGDEIKQILHERFKSRIKVI